MMGFFRNKWSLWFISGLLIVAAIMALAVWVIPMLPSDKLQPAPEAEQVLASQQALPFQILIPAYLPAGFQRKSVEIRTNLTGPRGGSMVELVYVHPRGVTLTLTEWASETGEVAESAALDEDGVRRCSCFCSTDGECEADHWMVDNGIVSVMGKSSNASLLSPAHIQLILQTLAPAGGLLTYSSVDELPVLPGLPPAEEIAINADGVQEVMLVISPTGYTPVHFSVKAGIPVRLVFRQLGDVGCGNELDFSWGKELSSQLVLTDPTSTQVLEFTPKEEGDFLFHCPHMIYQGVMTVVK